MRRPVLIAVMVTTTCAGCTWARKASVDAIDPRLRAAAVPIDRVDAHDEGFRIGEYAVQGGEASREPTDPSGALARDGQARPVVQHRVALGLRRDASPRAWQVQCVSQRRASASTDYASALDESRDEIAVRCELTDDGAPAWTFRSEAEVSENFAGRLVRHGGDRALTVEIVLWAQRFGRLQRPLPEPVAQVRDGDRVVAAMVLAQPEQAWLSPEIDPEVAEVSLATMLGIHMLPLGLQ